MLKRIKGFLSSKVGKAFSVASVSALIASIGCLTCFAEASTPDMTSTLEESFNGMSSSVMSYIGVALPIALGIVAAIFGIKFAISFFQKITHKGGN